MGAPTESALLNEKIVLVVDDEKFSRSLVIRHLDALGVVIAYEATNGEEGLEYLGESWRAVDIVVIDFEMPLMNGLELLRAIRTGANDLRNDIPVIMLTGHTDSKLVSVALSLDVDGFIVKPIARDTLAARIRRILSTAREIKAASHYAKIDVKPFALGRKAPPKSPQPSQAAVAPGGRAVALEALEAPAVLSRDICLPDGAVVIEAGTKISPRLVERLRELAALGIKEVWIE